jgi:hypothetical protein
MFKQGHPQGEQKNKKKKNKKTTKKKNAMTTRDATHQAQETNHGLRAL